MAPSCGISSITGPQPGTVSGRFGNTARAGEVEGDPDAPEWHVGWILYSAY